MWLGVKSVDKTVGKACEPKNVHLFSCRGTESIEQL